MICIAVVNGLLQFMLIERQVRRGIAFRQRAWQHRRELRGVRKVYWKIYRISSAIIEVFKKQRVSAIISSRTGEIIPAAVHVWILTSILKISRLHLAD